MLQGPSSPQNIKNKHDIVFEMGRVLYVPIEGEAIEFASKSLTSENKSP